MEHNMYTLDMISQGKDMGKPTKQSNNATPKQALTPKYTHSPSIPHPSRNSPHKGHTQVFILFNGFFISNFFS